MIYRDARSGGGVDMLRKLMNDALGGRPFATEQWAGRVGLAVAVGLAYFMAARSHPL